MVPVDTAGLEVRYVNLNPADDEARAALERSALCKSPNFKKRREDGKPQIARRTAGEQGARLGNLVGIVQLPDRVQRCSRCWGEGRP